MATLGTAITADHVRQLTRLANALVFCFDGDRAGRAAAWRAAEAALPFAGGSVDLKFLLLPEGEDPDSLVRSRGTEDFQNRVREALPLSTFVLKTLKEQVDLESRDGRAKLVKLAQPLLARLSDDSIYRRLLADDLAAFIGMSAETFKLALDAESKSAPLPPMPARRDARGRRTAIAKIIRLVLHYPRAAGGLSNVEGLDSVDLPGADLLRRLLEITAADPDVMTGQLIEEFRDHPEEPYLKTLAGEEVQDEESAAPRVLADSLKLLVARHRQMAGASALRRRASPPESQDPGGL
jgi:DNA primase